jgi:parvulin-like peptidyl-prolyl isomerase
VKRKYLVLLGLTLSILAAEDKPAVAPDAVVATVNGQKMTADEVRKMVAGLPAQVQNAFTNDPKQFMKEYAWYQIQQASAVKNKLETQSPWKELLAFQRMMTLVQAEWNDAYLRVEVTPEQQQKYYENNKEKYRETRAKLIYIPFTDAVSEADAKAKAQTVAQQARSGADFVKLVKEYSQDSASAGQNGDIGMPVRSSTSQIPEPMRNAILALKAGQVSEPLRHQNGYYVFRAESAGVLPYEKVKDEIYKELKDVGFNEWKEKTKAQSSVQFENEAFFKSIKPEPKPSSK